MMATPRMSKWEQPAWDAAMKKAGTTIRMKSPATSATPSRPTGFPEHVFGLSLHTIYEMRCLLMDLYNDKILPEHITPEMVQDLRRAVARSTVTPASPWITFYPPSHPVHGPYGTITM